MLYLVRLESCCRGRQMSTLVTSVPGVTVLGNPRQDKDDLKELILCPHIRLLVG